MPIEAMLYYYATQLEYNLNDYEKLIAKAHIMQAYLTNFQINCQIGVNVMPSSLK